MNVVITGASRGIGRAIAAAFAAEGNTLLLCSRNSEKLEHTQEEISKNNKNSRIEIFAADLSKKNEAENFAQWCLQFGPIDVLVNNAGVYLPGNVLDEAEGTLEEMLAINLLSAYYIPRIIGNHMRKNKSGHIFIISSIAGLQAYENGGSYSISKYALNGLSDNLRHELKPYGVKLTNVLPGAVFTDSWGAFDNSNARIMEATDIAKTILAATKLSTQAVVEQIVLRPQLGDL